MNDYRTRIYVYIKFKTKELKFQKFYYNSIFVCKSFTDEYIQYTLNIRMHSVKEVSKKECRWLEEF